MNRENHLQRTRLRSVRWNCMHHVCLVEFYIIERTYLNNTKARNSALTCDDDALLCSSTTYPSPKSQDSKALTPNTRSTLWISRSTTSSLASKSGTLAE